MSFETNPQKLAELRMAMLRIAIANHLVRIEDLLPSSYKLTLVARNTDKPNADIVMTVDELPKVIESIKGLGGGK